MIINDKVGKESIAETSHQLTSLGVQVETDRMRLRHLMEKVISYSNPKIIQTVERFQSLGWEWILLEQEHLQTGSSLLMAEGKGTDMKACQQTDMKTQVHQVPS